MLCIESQDDYTHTVGSEPNFNESMYFHFHDPGNRLSGFLRLANRPNEGKGERTVCLYLPDGRVAFGFSRPEVASNEKMSGAGLDICVEEPFVTLRATFDGEINILDDPGILSDPRRLAVAPRAGCVAELTFTRLAEPYAQSFDGEGSAFAPNHYEQLMAVTGSITLGESAFVVAGTGLRDHSWGPRSWQAPWFYRWLHGSSPSSGFMAAYFGVERGAPLTGGFVWDGRRLHRCTDVRVTTDRNDHRTPRTVVVELVAADGKRWCFDGKVGVTVPLRHRRRDSSGIEQLTKILEGQVRWIADDGSELFGMCEYLDQIVNGVPVGIDV